METGFLKKLITVLALGFLLIIPKENLAFETGTRVLSIKQLTDTPSSEERPIWHPDGKRIIYDSRVYSDIDIWMMDSDGKNKVQITSEPTVEANPSFNPDATRILFY